MVRLTIPANTQKIYRGPHLIPRSYSNGVRFWGTAPPTRAPGELGEVFFNSEFETRGDFSAYTSFTHTDSPTRAAIVDDPSGLPFKVARIASEEGFTLGNEYARTAVETTSFVRSLARGNTNDTYYNAVSFYLSDEFINMTSVDWFSIVGLAWGPPWTGSGSVTIQLRSPETVDGPHRIMLGGAQLPIGEVHKNEWVSFIVGFKFAYEEEGGWVSIHRHNGTDWVNVPIEGDAKHRFNPLIRGGNDGWHTGTSNMANTARITVYGSKPNVVHFGPHVSAADFETAAHYALKLSNVPVVTLTPDPNDPGVFISNLTPDPNDPGVFMEILTEDPADPGVFIV